MNRGKYNTCVKALDPRYQAALDRFMGNRYWRQLYIRAPEGAKRYYERRFASAWPLRELTDQEKEESKAESEALYRSLKKNHERYGREKELAYQKTMAFRPKLNKKIRRNRRTSDALKWWVILDSNQ